MSMANAALDLAVVAAEAACILNDGIGHLLVPQHLFVWTATLEAQGRTSERYAATVRRTAMIAAIVGLYRLHEARTDLLVPWLYSDTELREHGFVTIREFVGDWSAFETLRHQYAAHATSRRAGQGRPGRILSGVVFGRALKRTGLWDAEAFLLRTREQLVPAVETIRDALLVRFPPAREFVEGGYLAEIEKGASS